MNTLSSFARGSRNFSTEPSVTRWPAENAKRGTAGNWLLVIAAFLVLSLMGSTFAQAQTDPFVGTWKLNVAKSTPARKSETRIVESSPTGLTVSVDRTNADGSNQQYSYTANLDGKSYPFTGTPPYGADSVAVTLGSSNTLTFNLSRGGKVVASGTLVVSADGKTSTLKSSGTDEKGAKVSSVSIYTKQ